ncbi:MAG: histidine kinase [Bacteroidota bacterium]
MSNPIFNGRAFIFYFATWIIVASIYAFVLIFGQGFAVYPALIDTLLSNFLFAAIGIGLSYDFYFSKQKKQGFTNVLTSHLITAASVIFIWYNLSNYLTSQILSTEEYQNSFNHSEFWKGAIGTGYYALMTLSFYIIDYARKVSKANERELKLEGALKQAELDMLKSQVNPHFLFNSLNSISSLTVSSPKCAQEMVIKLSQFLRHSLNKGSSHLHELKSELENLQLYLDIEKIRFQERLVFKNEVNDICLKTKVPNLILQPLVENAIKYGLYESLEPVEISLNCLEKEDCILLNLTNTFDSDSNNLKGEGIGLKNTQSRLNLIYGKEAQLLTEKAGNLFTVTLQVPKNQN